LYKWLKDPEFQAEFQQARRQVVDQAVTRLTALTSAAAEALERGLTSTVPAAEIRAAVAVFGNIKDLMIAGEQDQRLDKIEEALQTRVRELEKIIENYRSRNGATARN
jgi:hypothetical protein